MTPLQRGVKNIQLVSEHFLCSSNATGKTVCPQTMSAFSRGENPTNSSLWHNLQIKHEGTSSGDTFTARKWQFDSFRR